jgi:tetratricopeptide (TPR) repeat protein
MAIAGNSFTNQGLAGIVPLLTTDSWHGYFGEEVDLLPGGRYRPLSLVTFAVVEGNPDSWVAMGAALGKLGRRSEAIRAFRRAVALDPEFAPAYLNLGAAYIQSGEQQRGRQFLEKAYRLDPMLRP